MDLKDCFRKGLIKKTTKDTDLINSLIEMSDIKESAVKKANVDRIHVSAYVSLAYDSLREILEAICIKNEYKVISHVCLGELLRKILNNFDYESFDRLRWIRNNINYYGKKVDLDQGIKIINQTFKIKKNLIKLL